MIVTYDAFYQQRSVSAAFLHENLRSYDLKKFPLRLGSKFTTISDKIEELIDLKSKAEDKQDELSDAFPEGADENGYDYYGYPAWTPDNQNNQNDLDANGNDYNGYPGWDPTAPPPPNTGDNGLFKWGWGASLAIFNREDRESPSYRQNYKPGLSVSYGMDEKVFPLFGWPNPIIKAYFYISVKAGLSGGVTATFSKDHADNYLANSYQADKFAVEGKGKVTFAGGGVVGFQDFIEQATKDLFEISAEGKLSYPFELKIGYEVQDPKSLSDIKDGEWVGWLNHGPAVFTVKLQVKLTALNQIPFLDGWDWDVVDVDYPWTLSNKRTEQLF